ncbi:hypothetical protein B0O80DRAFT_430869 [Mortierella sp. GBAus27b]|nr:hypothetical protein B0O80DRAFT_430869 [Mortierella sp. GBAus27b]
MGTKYYCIAYHRSRLRHTAAVVEYSDEYTHIPRTAVDNHDGVLHASHPLVTPGSSGPISIIITIVTTTTATTTTTAPVSPGHLTSTSPSLPLSASPSFARRSLSFLSLTLSFILTCACPVSWVFLAVNLAGDPPL